MDKIKWEVLEQMEWRDKTFEPGEIITDSENGYMKAMEAQGKCKKA